MDHYDQLRRARSLLESPILDEHKWQKVPHIPADGILLDMEDSASPARKLEAREKVLEYLDRPDYFAGRPVIPRSNSLETPWGEDDLRALAASAAEVVLYPKVRTPGEVREVDALLRAGGSRAKLFVIVETAASVVNLEQIVATGLVSGLLFGPADLALDADFAHFADGDLFEEPYYYIRSKLILVAAAAGIPVFGIAFTPDMRDTTRVRQEVVRARRQGFTGLVTFYPPHVEIINEVFSASEEEIDEARRIVAAYEQSLESGAAALSQDGHAVLVHDFERARRLLERCKE
ncbi:MAG: HpcH/HpaI aldolase/citrate lyase family protein [Acidimicrobiales bacterium]